MHSKADSRPATMRTGWDGWMVFQLWSLCLSAVSRSLLSRARWQIRSLSSGSVPESDRVQSRTNKAVVSLLLIRSQARSRLGDYHQHMPPHHLLHECPPPPGSTHPKNPVEPERGLPPTSRAHFLRRLPRLFVSHLNEGPRCSRDTCPLWSLAPAQSIDVAAKRRHIPAQPNQALPRRAWCA